MEEVLRHGIHGLSVGCVYALVATGLVLTYRTAGVFNLAFGAQAFVSAAVFYELRETNGWALVPALVVAVGVVAPLLGAVLDRVLFRHLRTRGTLATLVVALALMVAIPALVQIWFGAETKFNPPSVAPDPDRVFRFGDQFVNADEMTTVVVTIFVVIALTVLLRSTALGLKMRAVVESPRMVELAGVNADRVGTTAWMLASGLAGVAGVLLAPLFQTVDAQTFTVLLVAATAAAAFGRLTSIPLTLAGGVALGVMQQVVASYVEPDSVWARGLRPSLPFIVLVALLLLWAGRNRRELTDPLAGVDPPPPAPAATYRDPRLQRVTRVTFAALVAGVLLLGLVVLPGYRVAQLSEGAAYTMIFLSIVLLIGMSGQLALCPATFAGVGAFTAAQLVDRWDVSILAAIGVAALVAAVVGALVALPALRLGGLYLALATLAFALMVDSVVFPLEDVSGGASGVAVPRPVVGSVDFSGDRAFFLLSFAFLVVVGLAVVLLRRGTTGRFLAALRGSEVAAASIGINPMRAKVTVFALSAAIAGVGGALLVTLTGSAYPTSFNPLLGLFWIVVVVSIGSRTVEGAVVAGVVYTVLPEVLEELGVASDISSAVQYAVFGIAALTFVRRPEGLVESVKRFTILQANRLLGARSPAAPPAGDAAVRTEAEAREAAV